MRMVKEVNRLARMIPREHLDLIWQLRRAARSVVLNIAEGAGEYALKEKARFYRIARRSALETIAALDMAIDEEFLAQGDLPNVLELLDAVIGMLTTMSKRAELADAHRACERPNPRPRPRPRLRMPA